MRRGASVLAAILLALVLVVGIGVTTSSAQCCDCCATCAVTTCTTCCTTCTTCNCCNCCDCCVRGYWKAVTTCDPGHWECVWVADPCCCGCGHYESRFVPGKCKVHWEWVPACECD